MLVYLGCDPGTSDNMALAAIHPSGSIEVALCGTTKPAEARDRASSAATEISRAFSKLLLPQFCPAVLAMEWQCSRPNDPRPDNIIDLSAFVGIALATIQVRMGSTPLEIFLPTPDEWKGNVPKHVKQNRIVALAGLSHVQHALIMARIPVPKDLGKFQKTSSAKASDVIDAIGLAQWAKARAAMRDTVRSALAKPAPAR
jgi:hypothetical protein